MSREHLYKAKRVNWGELPKKEWWVEGHLTQRKDSYGKVFESWIVLDAYEQLGVLNMKSALVSEIDFNCYKVIPETVCEYTGLTDKNGRKIFEGDILRFEDCSNYPVVWDSDYCAFGSCWYSDFDHLSKYRSIKIEVVGNIFDNPELLEGGEAE